MNRLPLEIDVIWFESRPRIDFKLNSNAGVQSFRGEDTGELLRNLATAHANLLVQAERLKRENKTLRQELNR